MIATPQQLAQTLAQTILDDIRDDEDLATCRSFSELHDHTDANCLGSSELYFAMYGAEVVQLAQEIVDEELHFGLGPATDDDRSNGPRR